MTKNGHAVRIALAASLLAGTFASSADELAFDAFFVFGDSLSDTGNTLNATGGLIPRAPTYTGPGILAPVGGRFSNGPVWVEHLAEQVGTELSRPLLPDALAPPGGSAVYAFGGSTSFAENSYPFLPLPGINPPPPPTVTLDGLGNQVEDFVQFRAPADPNALYTVVTGANDYAASTVIAFGPDGSTFPAPFPPATVGNIDAAVRALRDVGAQHVMVGDLPNLAFVPLVQLLASMAPDPQAVLDELSAVVDLHNELLRLAIVQLEASSPDLELYLLRFHDLADQIAQDPALFGFQSLAPGPALACHVPPFTCDPDGDGMEVDATDFPNFDGSLFWDEQHLTTIGHERLADLAGSTLRTGSVLVPAIDIIPGSVTNQLNLRSNRRLKVVIFGGLAAGFGDPVDAHAVDAASARFGPAGAAPVRSRLKDRNRDGIVDLELTFRLAESGIVCGATAASLSAKTDTSRRILGADAVTTVGCP